MPYDCPRMTNPASMARPPTVVTTNACDAAARLARSSAACPISKYDRTVVSSQKTLSKIRSSLVTRPSIAPANAVNSPANRPSDGLSASK